MNHRINMKKIIILLVWLLSIAAIIVSCDDMNSIHQKYIDDGERIYLSQTDSLKAYPGVGRVKLVWNVSADPQLETTVIFWNMRKDSIERSFTRTQEWMQKDSVIIPLPEGTYNFELVNKNQLGGRSMTAVVQGKSYGERFASDLKARSIAGILSAGFDPVAQSSTVKIIWGEAPEGSIGTKLMYIKRTTGEELVLDVDNTATETILTDVGNRLEYPDDILHVSSIYAPNGCIDPIETLKQKEQLVHYVASGTRIENTIFDGSNETYTYTYTNQEKTIRLMSAAGDRVFNCNRVAELSPVATGSSFLLTLNEDQAVGIRGNFVVPLNFISNTESVNSTYNSETRNFTLQYTVKTAGGSYTVEETLIPKTSPFESESPKPFGDLRAIIPGDNNTEHESGLYPFSNISNGILPPTLNGWLTQNIAGGTSFTIDLKQVMKLTRMIKWPASEGTAATFYTNANILRFEMWGVEELDPAKLQDNAYWVDAADPAGTFKEDWEYFGIHDVERLDLKNATLAEVRAMALYGYHFVLPESAKPVRYVRIYVRAGTWPANLAYFFIGQFSFFGYAQ